MQSKSDYFTLWCVWKKYSPFVVASFLRQSSSENLGSCSNSDTCHTLLVGVGSCRLWVYKRARRSCSSKNLRFMRAIINANEMPSLSKHLSFHTFFWYERGISLGSSVNFKGTGCILFRMGDSCQLIEFWVSTALKSLFFVLLFKNSFQHCF